MRLIDISGQKGCLICLLQLFVLASVFYIYKSTFAIKAKEYDVLRNPLPMKNEIKVVPDDPVSSFDESLEVSLLKTSILIPPSDKEYNLEFQEEQSKGQGQLIRKLFNEKKGGFFIECGALDGETRSNTLTLEKELGWTGLLIEGDPSNVKEILPKHRKAWVLPNCLSPHKRMYKASYKPGRNLGKIVNNPKVKEQRRGNLIDVVCFPLYSVLMALDKFEIDYFSLDVEGHEYEVLKTIPFHLVDIKALSVEFSHVGENTQGNKNELVQFMESQGYEVRATVTNKNGLANDYIFVKKGFNPDVILENIAT